MISLVDRLGGPWSTDGDGFTDGGGAAGSSAVRGARILRGRVEGGGADAVHGGLDILDDLLGVVEFPAILAELVEGGRDGGRINAWADGAIAGA